MKNYYWINTESSEGFYWTLYCRDSVNEGEDEAVAAGMWPDDAIGGAALTPERQEEIWESVDSQIEETLGFVPDYDIN